MLAFSWSKWLFLGEGALTMVKISFSFLFIVMRPIWTSNIKSVPRRKNIRDPVTSVIFPLNLLRSIYENKQRKLSYYKIKPHPLPKLSLRKGSKEWISRDIQHFSLEIQIMTGCELIKGYASCTDNVFIPLINTLKNFPKKSKKNYYLFLKIP